jgi:DNA-binding transcriptional LysR family regulator
VSADGLAKAELVMRGEGSGTRTVVEEAYGKHALELSLKLSVANTEAIKRLLRLGYAVAWVFRHSVADDLVSGALVQLPVVDLKIERDLNIVWRKARVLSPRARAFH